MRASPAAENRNLSGVTNRQKVIPPYPPTPSTLKPYISAANGRIGTLAAANVLSRRGLSDGALVYFPDESATFWLYVNPTKSVSENLWLPYLGVTEPFFQRMLEVAYTTPTGMKHDPRRKRTGPIRTFDTADLLALGLRWIHSTDDAEGLSAQWRVLPGNFGRQRNAAATLLNEVLKMMPEADVHTPSKEVQRLYADCLARSIDDVYLSDETFSTVKPIGLIDAYPISVPEFGGRYCQAMFMNVKYGGHCVLNVKAIAPDGTCFFANVNIPGGSSEWTAAQPIIEQLRNKSLFIDGAVLIGDSLYRVKKAADVLLAVPKVREAVRKKRRECVCVCV